MSGTLKMKATTDHSIWVNEYPKLKEVGGVPYWMMRTTIVWILNNRRVI
jgi:hypothetical protein